jgi:RNA polymerase sigma-70 factor, ECF subfamily
VTIAANFRRASDRLRGETGKMSDDEFEARLVAAREGSEWALTALYRALYPRIVAYLRAVEPADADDLASDTWLDVARGLLRFRGDEHGLLAWAFTIARRRVTDLRRQRARKHIVPTPPDVLAEAGGIGDAEQEAFDSLGSDWAFALITSSLPRDQAEVVLLSVLGNLGAKEVARIVGKRQGTVRVLQHRALRRLAHVLETQGVTR